MIDCIRHLRAQSGHAICGIHNSTSLGSETLVTRAYPSMMSPRNQRDSDHSACKCRRIKDKTHFLRHELGQADPVIARRRKQVLGGNRCETLGGENRSQKALCDTRLDPFPMFPEKRLETDPVSPCKTGNGLVLWLQTTQIDTLEFSNPRKWRQKGAP